MSYTTTGMESKNDDREEASEPISVSSRKRQNIISEFFGRMLYIVPKTPKYAQIEITNSCNLNCKMCPREFLKVPYKHMDLKDYRKVVDNLGPVHTLTLTGWGEPFFFDGIFDCIKYAKDNGLKVKITNNGTLLNNEKIEKIFETGLDELTFSLDHIKGDPDFGHPNKVALNNIEKIIRTREERGLDHPKVVLQPTMHAGKTRNVMDVIKWGASVGADRINIARLDLRFDPNLKRATAAEEQKLFRAADKLGKVKGIRVDMVQHAAFDGASRLVYRLFKRIMHRLDHKCSKTYNYIYINVDGFVTPCCFFPHMKRGDLKQDGEDVLEKIWNDRPFRIFRKNQETICGKCDVMKVRYLEN